MALIAKARHVFARLDLIVKKEKMITQGLATCQALMAERRQS
jgi:hypothetical protein